MTSPYGNPNEQRRSSPYDSSLPPADLTPQQPPRRAPRKKGKDSKERALKWGVGIFSVVAFIGILFGMFGDNSGSGPVRYSSEEPSGSSLLADNDPNDQDAALAKAESYMSYSNFSKEGLLRQLHSEHGEGFSDEAARYAVDTIDIDWNEKAVASANAHTKNSDISRAGLEHLLTSDRGLAFTEEETQFALDNMEPVDWNEQAFKAAQQVYDNGTRDRETLHHILTSDTGKRFTEEEAEYAMDKLGV
ncbi:MAG: Ltp family lipoprotein [Corynebacterium camporealensis]|uniref:Ltp family lipoprotein n=1 Tax=Corynebacterium camporealensis TaxID=161896 RepID=UPI002A9202BF|nr:Ltp family lipoprotein [Corynebacterium camporealensis]MDY5840484.1 Ltp family lipoprotein [Corynebacterium camporealensis]